MADVTRPAYRPLAGISRRTVAYLIDLAVVGVPVLLATGDDRSPARRALTLGRRAAVVGTLYHALLEGLTGRTVGKAAVDIAVVGADGSGCTLRAAAVRTLGRFLDGLPVAYLLGVASVALTDRRQRVGDLLAGTVVVRTRGPG